MVKKLTPKKRELLESMWSCWFARSMTLTDFSRNTINALEQEGLIAWDVEADRAHGASGPAKYGLTAYGFAICEREFGPRKDAAS
jgi:hypothetical protein